MKSIATTRETGYSVWQERTMSNNYLNPLPAAERAEAIMRRMVIMGWDADTRFDTVIQGGLEWRALGVKL